MAKSSAPLQDWSAATIAPPTKDNTLAADTIGDVKTGSAETEYDGQDVPDFQAMTNRI